MTSPKQVQINFNLSEDFRRNLHGEWVLKPGVLSQKAEKLNLQLVKHKSEVEDLASQFPETPTPKYRTKEKVFAMQSLVKGATWCNVVMSVVDDRASTSKEPVIDAVGLTRRFTYTGKATTCDWTRYGIKIHFPDYDSTEDDTNISASGSDDDPEKNQSKCHLNEDDGNQIVVTIVNVRLCPSTFELPDNTELTSGIYSITSSRPFNKPVRLVLGHDLSTEDEASWLSELRFVIASPISSTSPTAVFEILPGGTFPPGHGWGSISLTHFSLYAIVVKMRGVISSAMQQVVPRRQQVPSAQQQASVHKYSCRYFKIHLRNYFEVHMVITRDLGVCNREVESEFSARNAMYGSSQEVKFEKETILLEVPPEGIQHQGWKITPLTHPEIMKENVDNYQPGMRIPSCSLQFKWTRDGPPVNETYTLRLQGAREPYNYFNIDCELQQGMNVVQPQPEITLPTLMRMNLHQNVGTHYQEFGTFLLLDHTGKRVQNMEHTFTNNPQFINVEILREWLDGRGRRPVTWGTLVEVLREIELYTLANDIEQAQASCT